MSTPHDLMKEAAVVDEDDTVELNKHINQILEEYGGRTRTMWLFLLATRYYIDLEGEDKYDLTDYQMAAEQIMRDAETHEGDGDEE